MSTEVFASVVGGLIQVIGGAIFGFIIARITTKWQHGRKRMEYIVSSMPLLRFNPSANHVLSVSVDKFLLTGIDTDKGNTVQIENAYGFEIELINAGEEAIVQPNIEIRLDDKAKILEYETRPGSRPGYEIIMQRESRTPNILRLTIPFINSKEKMLARIISTNNENRDCKIDVIAIGVHKYERKRSNTNLRLIASVIIYMIIGLFVSTIDYWLPSSAILAIGGIVQTRSRLLLPIWLQAFILIALTTILLIPMIHARRVRKRSRDRHISWDL